MSAKPPPDAPGIAGAADPALNAYLVEQTVSTLWALNADDAGQRKAITAAIAQLRDIQARDVMEGMLAAQMVASHAAAMECFRRAMLKDQPMQARTMNLSQANKASRTYAALLEALNRHRGKGQQRVTVEHVHVHAGAQAVVGTIERFSTAMNRTGFPLWLTSDSNSLLAEGGQHGWLNLFRWIYVRGFWLRLMTG